MGVKRNPCFLPQKKQPKDRAWSLKKMKVIKAWENVPPIGGSRYGEGILIGHPDTGYADHVDLDRSGLRLDLGKDFVDDDNDPRDPLNKGPSWYNPGHGLGTGSVIMSRGGVPEEAPPPDTEGGTGPPGKVTGVATRSSLVPIRAIKTVIRIFSSNVAKAIHHATVNDCRVISLSLGGLPSRALRASLEYAIERNVIVVAAAGNCVGFVVYPARYDICIGVAATNQYDKPWQGSSHGSAVAFSAPGEFVWKAHRELKTDPTDQVKGGQGTSYSAANVAGIAALWLAHWNPEYLFKKWGGRAKLQLIFKRLAMDTCRKPLKWDPSEYGSGIIDALALLKTEPSKIMEDAIKDTIRFYKSPYLYEALLSDWLDTKWNLGKELHDMLVEVVFLLVNDWKITEALKKDFIMTTDPKKRRRSLFNRLRGMASPRLLNALR